MGFNVTGKITQSGKLSVPSAAPPVIVGYDPATATSSGWTLSNSDFTASAPGPGEGGVRGLTEMSSGKFYWESTFDSGNNNGFSGFTGYTGVITAGMALYGNADTYMIYYATGDVFNAGGSINTGYLASFSAGNTLGIALDLDNNAAWFSKNGAWGGGSTIGEIEAGTTTNAAVTGLSGSFYAVLADATNQVHQHTTNFGQDEFSYTVPTGFQAGIY